MLSLSHILPVCIALLCFSCKKNSSVPSTHDGIEGKYEGTFQKQDTGGYGAISKVKISFSDHNYDVNSSSIKDYPVLVAGIYSLTTKLDSLKLTTLYQFPNSLEWAVVPEGSFNIRHIGDSLNFSRGGFEGNNKYISIYRLKRIDY